MNISTTFRARLFRHNMIPEFFRLSFAKKLTFSFFVQGDYVANGVPDQISKVIGLSKLFSNHRMSTRIGINKYYDSRLGSFMPVPGMFDIYAYRYLKGVRIYKKMFTITGGETVSGYIQNDGKIVIDIPGSPDGDLYVNFPPQGYGKHFLWRLSTGWFGGKIPLISGVFNFVINFSTR